MNRELLAQELTRDEDKRNKVYKDSLGIETIGVGRNLRDKGLSDDEISYLLKNDMAETEIALDRAFPWWRQMSDARQRVIANMCFNLGINKLSGFVNTLRAMKEGRYDDAADGMLKSLWASQVGDRAKRLAQMMREG
jgi:lysozyme